MKHIMNIFVVMTIFACSSCSDNDLDTVRKHLEDSQKRRPIGYRCLEPGEKIEIGRFRMPCSIMQWNSSDYYSDPRHIEMCHAIEYENYEEIEKLLNSGIDINTLGQGNMNFLFWGLPNGPKMFEFLLEKGANPNVRFENDVSPKEIAFFGSVAACTMTLSNEYIKLFLKYGGNPNLKTSSASKNLLYYIALNDDLDIIENKMQILISAGIDINHRDIQGKTILVDSPGSQLWQLLLEAGADYRIPDNEGKTIIEIIVRESEFLKNKQSQYEKFIQPLVDFFKKEGIDLSLHGNDYTRLRNILFLNIENPNPLSVLEDRKKQRSMFNEYYAELWGENYLKWFKIN